jgi:hypothetical protein
MKLYTYRLAADIRTRMRKSPLLYRIGAHIARAPHVLVDRDCDICVEAVPRCANSFAVNLIHEVAPQLKIAHHTHAVANVKKAIALDLPVFVIVREPLGFLASYVLRRNEIRGENVDKNIIYGAMEYKRFYGFVLTHIVCVEVMDFKRIVGDPLALISTVHRRNPSLVPRVAASSLDSHISQAWERFKAYEETRGYGTLASSIPSEERKHRSAYIKEAILQGYASELDGLRKLYHSLTEAACNARSSQLDQKASRVGTPGAGESG